MTWNFPPAGVSAFPNDTAEQWATEMFTPITAPNLNKLKENLDHLHVPNYAVARTEIGSTTQTVNAGEVYVQNGAGTLEVSLTYHGGLLLYVFTCRAISNYLAGDHYNLRFDAYISAVGQTTFRATGGYIADTTKWLAQVVGQASISNYRNVAIFKIINPLALWTISAPLTIYINPTVKNFGTGGTLYDPNVFVKEL